MSKEVWILVGVSSRTMRILHKKKTAGRAEHGLHKPDILSLFAHIARALVTGGLLLPATGGTGLLLFAEQNRAPELASVAIVAMVVVVMLAVLKGCSNWQYDLVEYQRDRAIRFKTGHDSQTHSIPGFYNSRR